MTNEHNEQAILLLHTLRTGYICDPNECKFTKGDENCILCECDNYHDALALAIECIEKQIPKKPIAYGKSWNGTTVYKCPACDKPLGTKSFNEEQEQIGCARCLSAIDWSEVE